MPNRPDCRPAATSDRTAAPTAAADRPVAPAGRRRRRRAAALAGMLLLPGCMFSVEHVLGTDGPNFTHPWHQWPARAGMFLVTVPMTVLVSPLALLEDVLTERSLFRKQSPGITSYMVGIPATVGAYAVSTPFLLLGMPWEFGDPKAPDPDEVEPEDG